MSNKNDLVGRILAQRSWHCLLRAPGQIDLHRNFVLHRQGGQRRGLDPEIGEGGRNRARNVLFCPFRGHFEGPLAVMRRVASKLNFEIGPDLREVEADSGRRVHTVTMANSAPRVT